MHSSIAGAPNNILKDICPHVFSASTIHNSQDMKTTQGPKKDE